MTQHKPLEIIMVILVIVDILIMSNIFHLCQSHKRHCHIQSFNIIFIIVNLMIDKPFCGATGVGLDFLPVFLLPPTFTFFFLLNYSFSTFYFHFLSSSLLFSHPSCIDAILTATFTLILPPLFQLPSPSVIFAFFVLDYFHFLPLLIVSLSSIFAAIIFTFTDNYTYIYNIYVKNLISFGACSQTQD